VIAFALSDHGATLRTNLPPNPPGAQTSHSL
jgi:hypothetical protein